MLAAVFTRINPVPFTTMALTLVLGLGASALTGCDAGPGGATPIAQKRQGLCAPGDMTCACADNVECIGFDEDTRLIICNVPTGAMTGTCLDCTTVAAKPVGCACKVDADCGGGAKCNGRTCQTLRARGEFCVRDSDCGSDMVGAMRCLPTKLWCGPLLDGNFCDFDDDCVNGKCNELGLCTSGEAGDDCVDDTGCKPGLLCHSVTYKCILQKSLMDGEPCLRNQECVNQCNSFSGRCLLGSEGEACTTTHNPAGANGDCDQSVMPALLCTNCGGAFTCRPPGSTCP
jgi:hypothetical protein